jgi:hypothetical protein
VFGSDVRAPVYIELKTVELCSGVGIPVEGQLGRVVEAVTVVVRPAGQGLHGLAEVLEHFSPMLERSP